MFELNHKNVKKLLGIITFTIVLFWISQNLTIVGNLLQILFQLILPFIIGICIAFVLNIPINLLENTIFKFKNKKKITIQNRVKRRILTLSISILLLIAILGVVIFLIVPELMTAFHVFQENIPSIISSFQFWLEEITGNYPDLSGQVQNADLNWNSIKTQIWGFAQLGITTIVTTSFNFVVATITTIINFFIGMIFAIYLLMQKETLLKQAKKLVLAYFKEEKAKKILHIAKLSNKTFNDFLSGQMLEACILGILCFIGMLILQIPYAVAISILITVTALIPLVGAFIGTGVGIILIVVSSPIKAFIFVIFILILQQIEGNLIYPKVVGKSVGLPPIWVLVAITLGASLLGLIGIIISVPICSILYVLIRENTNERLKHKKIQIDD